MHDYTLHLPKTEARDTQRTPKPPPVTKPYLWKSEPLVRFRTDDGKVYLEQHHALRGVYDEDTKTLSVKIGGGTIAATGSGAWELCENLCTGKATMICSGGVQVTSVAFIPDKDEESVDL